MSSVNYFLPYIRIKNYFSDYFLTVYKALIKNYKCYWCTYYSVDIGKSVYDDEFLRAGTYEKYSIGNLSGMKFKKIMMLPVFGVDQITPQYESGERGLTTVETERTSIQFPDIYGLIPNPGDIVHFDELFMSKSSISTPIFVVTNAPDVAHYGNDCQLYKLSLKVAGVRSDELTPHISSTHMFVDYFKKIYDFDHAQILFNLENLGCQTSEKLKQYIHPTTGIYLHPKTDYMQNFREIYFYKDGGKRIC